MSEPQREVVWDTRGMTDQRQQRPGLRMFNNEQIDPRQPPYPQGAIHNHRSTIQFSNSRPENEEIEAFNGRTPPPVYSNNPIREQEDVFNNNHHPNSDYRRDPARAIPQQAFRDPVKLGMIQGLGNVAIEANYAADEIQDHEHRRPLIRNSNIQNWLQGVEDSSGYRIYRNNEHTKPLIQVNHQLTNHPIRNREVNSLNNQTNLVRFQQLQGQQAHQAHLAQIQQDINDPQRNITAASRVPLNTPNLSPNTRRPLRFWTPDENTLSSFHHFLRLPYNNWSQFIAVAEITHHIATSPNLPFASHPRAWWSPTSTTHQNLIHIILQVPRAQWGTFIDFIEAAELLNPGATQHLSPDVRGDVWRPELVPFENFRNITMRVPREQWTGLISVVEMARYLLEEGYGFAGVREER